MMTINEEDASPTDPSDKEVRSRINEKALQLLARREHARQELSTKLAQRGFPRDLIAEELDQLELEGYLSDERFAREKARALILQDYGPRYIRGYMKNLGVSIGSEKILEVYAELEIKPQTQMHRLIEKKISSLLNGNTEERNLRKIESKVAEYLYRRGFDSQNQLDHVKDLVKEHSA